MKEIDSSSVNQMGKYAVYCCNILHRIKDVEFKRCRRCGKILKDSKNESEVDVSSN